VCILSLNSVTAFMWAIRQQDATGLHFSYRSHASMTSSPQFWYLLCGAPWGVVLACVCHPEDEHGRGTKLPSLSPVDISLCQAWAHGIGTRPIAIQWGNALKLLYCTMLRALQFDSEKSAFAGFLVRLDRAGCPGVFGRWALSPKCPRL
jgi:hypothetical protein